MSDSKSLGIQFKSLLKRAIFLPFALMMLLALIVLWQIGQYSKASFMVLHTSQVQDNINRIQNALIDMETGMRWYLLSKDSKFLNSYHQARTEIYSELSSLAQQVSKNSSQVERTKGLMRSIDDWQDYASGRIIEAARQLTAPPRPFRDTHGKVHMERLRRQIGEVLSEENRLMRVRTERLWHTQRRLYLVILVITLSCSGLLALFARRNLLELSNVYKSALDFGARTQSALQQERDFTSAVLETVGSLVVVLDQNGKIVCVNRACERATGYSRTELEHKLIFDFLIPPDERENARETYRRLEMSYFPNQHEKSLFMKDGSLRLFAWSNAAIADEAGKVRYVITTGVDITDQKRNEQALREQAEELEKIMDTAPVAILVSYDPECRHILGNRKANQFVEAHSGENVSARPAFGESVVERKFFRGGRELRPEELPMQIAAARNEDVRNSELEIMAPSGQRIYVLGSATPLRDANGKVRGCLGAYLDITERKATEARLKYLASFPEKNPHPIIEADFEGHLKYANPAALRLFPNIMEKGRKHPYLSDWEEKSRSIRVGDDETRDYNIRFADHSFQQTFARSSEKGMIRVYGLDITKRVRSEEALQESRSKLDAALASMTDAVFISDANGRLVEFNDGFATYHRFRSKDEATRNLADYSDILDVYFPDGTLAPLDMWAVPRALRGETATNVEYTLKRKDTGETWVGLYSFSPIRNDRNEIVGSVVVGRDISDRKLAEEALKDNEARLRAVLENMSEGIVMFDREGNIIYQNPASLKIHSIAPHEEAEEIKVSSIPLSWNVWNEKGEVLPFEAWPSSRVGRGEQVRDIILHVKKVGTNHEFWGSYNGCPIFDSKGNLTLAFITIREISEQMRAAEALRKSEEDFRILVDAIPQMVWTADSRGVVNYNNDRWYQFTGLSPNQASGDAWLSLVHPDDQDRIVQRWTHAVRTGGDYEVEIRFKRGLDQQYRWILVRALLVKDEQGRFIKWFGTNTDIHEQKQIASELTTAVKARDEFLSIASHELNTPLASLRLQAELLKKYIEKGHPDAYAPEKINRMAHQTDRQVSRLVRLVDDMLDVSRIESGKFVITMQPEKVVFCEIIKEVVERLKPQMLAAGTFPIFECMDPAEGSWDCFRMEQVVTNLMTNAMRYGRGKPVRIRVEKKGIDRLRMCVRDEGIGISPENQERIFNRFERAVSATEISGLGLGLFISREIVKLHGGKMWVESELNQGATFYVELPLQKPTQVLKEVYHSRIQADANHLPERISDRKDGRPTALKETGIPSF